MAASPDADDASRYEYGVSRRYFERHCSQNSEMVEDMRLAVESLIGITQEEKAAAQELAERYAEIERRIEAELSSTLATTGFQFEGFDIVEYHGIVSANYVQGTGIKTDVLSGLSDLVGIGSKSLQSSIDSAYCSSRNELLRKAIRAGGNAILGVDFKPFIFAGDMVGVLATGTAVTIVKK